MCTWTPDPEGFSCEYEAFSPASRMQETLKMASSVLWPVISDPPVCLKSFPRHVASVELPCHLAEMTVAARLKQRAGLPANQAAERFLSEWRDEPAHEC